MMTRVPCCVFLYLATAPTALAIDVTPVTGPNDAFALATMLVDPASSIHNNSANFLIDTLGGGTAASEIRAIGTFVNGNAGGLLPAINQLDLQNPISYASGIGIDAGVCLCTGLITDADVDGQFAITGSGVGVEGPNNGFPISSLPPPPPNFTPLNAGEVSFRTNTPRDKDFVEKVNEVQPTEEGDATVLQFEIQLLAPGYLRISFVLASDEHPFWIDDDSPFDANDSMAIFIRQESNPLAEFENLAILKSPGEPDQPMSLRELRDCGPILFKNNQVVPRPDQALIPETGVENFSTSDHGFDINEDGFNLPDDGVPYYNHEFGGFSKVLTRETPQPLAVGNYTIKIVVQDVFDRAVDSAVFVEAESLKLYFFAYGDYNGDGVVDDADYGVWASHFGMTNATFYDGDGNGDSVVNILDYLVWRNSVGATGNGDFRADFNRDGAVNGLDYFIWLGFAGLQACASRFEGDANGDGAIDRADLVIWQEEFGSGMSMMAAMGECLGSGSDVSSSHG